MKKVFASGLFVVLVALLTPSCLPSNTPEHTATCKAACGNLTKLGCRNGGDASDGTPCETWLCESQVCRDDGGEARRWGKIAAAETCEVARRAACE